YRNLECVCIRLIKVFESCLEAEICFRHLFFAGTEWDLVTGIQSESIDLCVMEARDENTVLCAEFFDQTVEYSRHQTAFVCFRFIFDVDIYQFVRIVFKQFPQSEDFGICMASER